MVIVMHGTQGNVDTFGGVFPDLDAANDEIVKLEDNGSFVQVFSVENEPLYDTEG